MAMYPSDAKKTMADVESRDQCRAFRVFEHYIRQLQKKLGLKINEVFLCQKVTGEHGRQVFSCETCSRRTDTNLFDGVRQDGSYKTIGMCVSGPSGPPPLM